jgi:integrase
MSLTIKRVAKLVRAGKEGDYLDGPPAGVRGLYLQIRNQKNASWGLRYQLHGRTHWMGLGSALLGDGVALDVAREKAKAARQQLRDKIDPLTVRRQQHASQAAAALGIITFAEAAKQFHAHHEAGWKNRKHAAQVIQTLQTYANPILGALSVADIDTPLVLRVLEPIWNKKPETASRVRGRIESVLAWAAVRGYRPKGDNPARWKGHLNQALPKRSRVAVVNHHKAMPYAEVPTFMPQLLAREGIAAQALAFTIMTAARSGEVLGARWSEIDLENETWTVPAGRMKAGKEHRVPLAPQVIELLHSLPRDAVASDGYLFIGAAAGATLCHTAMSAVLKRMKLDVVPHGFRSSFSTWAGEQTNFAREVVEQSLAHVIGNKVEAAYKRTTLFDKRRKLMDAWAKYCLTPPAKTSTDNVVAIGATR